MSAFALVPYVDTGSKKYLMLLVAAKKGNGIGAGWNDFFAILGGI